jgi:1,6-anhydro-N-acetylmuramate kinase
MTEPRVRHVVGCMTGTSLDGLDCALTRITGTGLDMTAEFVGMVSRPFDDDFRATLRHLAEGNPAPPIDYLRAARTLGVLHADAVEALLREHPLAPGSARGSSRGKDALKPPRAEPGANGGAAEGGMFPGLDFVVAHGQTIWHAPQDTLSWQLFDPWPLVQHLGVPVCYDLRQADLIAGGQGAPITPLADPILYRKAIDRGHACVLNLGGICNDTHFDRQATFVEGGDITVCNILLDGLIQRLIPSMPFDRDGLIAFRGQAIPKVIDDIHELIGRPIINEKSLGREDYDNSFFQQLMHKIADGHANEDILASAVVAVASNIRSVLCDLNPDVVILAGGGARNRALAANIAKPTLYDGKRFRCILSDDLGIPCETREAVGFAVLGALSQDGVPITLPRVTGAKASGGPGVAGAWVYPK